MEWSSPEKLRPIRGFAMDVSLDNRKDRIPQNHLPHCLQDSSGDNSILGFVDRNDLAALVCRDRQ
jgi:hypothetical protein